MTKQEALKKVACVAMADLFGCSEPPNGTPDSYPFNACRWRDTFPADWQHELEAVIRYVYHHEDIPEGMKGV